MVGEIRDYETARIAVESALTGHLVLSTLHTNDAASAINRLGEMGIENYLLASTVTGVLAQRLVRRNCTACMREEVVDPLVRSVLGVDKDEVFFKGAGCDACNGTGYRGRMAVYELLPVTAEMRELIVRGGSVSALHTLANQQGMTPLTRQALAVARQRLTSLEEAYRVRLD
jgi:type IV pilus assembly protein PilB